MSQTAIGRRPYELDRPAVTRMSELDREMRCVVAAAAVYCRHNASNGNIEVIRAASVMRALGEHVIGETEFAEWERWHAPAHVVHRRALENAPPGH